jgi:hypothetical protein
VKGKPLPLENQSVSLPFRYRFATVSLPIFGLGWVGRLKSDEGAATKIGRQRVDAEKYVDLARVFPRAHSQPGTSRPRMATLD